MIHLNEIPLDYEPRRIILPKLPVVPTEPEMSEFESAFLCGAIKQFRPKKILEVGLAGGATTAIILQALEDNGDSYQMYSIDASSTFYRDRNKSTGFIATFIYSPLSQPCGVNTKCTLESFCRKSLTR